MSKLLILYGFNTYFNRTIKKFSTYNEYKSLGEEQIHLELSNVNFDISDGVYAKHTINATKLNPAYNKNPNYVVAEDADGNLSRWFVLEAVKQRGGQFVLSLKRDVIADYSDLIKTAPAFIQKGMLDVNSPLLFNNEGMKFNEIKKKEILLKDKTTASWIVGYLARNDNTIKDQPITISGISEYIASGEIDYNDLPSSIINSLNKETTCLEKENIRLDIRIGYGPATRGEAFWNYFWLNENNITNFYYDDVKYVPRTYSLTNVNLSSTGKINNDLKNCIVVSDILTAINNGNNYANVSKNDFERYNNKIIIRDNKKYTLIFKSVGRVPLGFNVIGSDLGVTQMGQKFNEIKARMLQNSEYRSSSIDANNKCGEIYTENGIEVFVPQLVEGAVTNVTTSLHKERNELLDAPYDMFCIPMSGFVIEVHDDPELIEIETTNEVALAIARAISLSLGSNVYDIQILPYCPFPEMFGVNGRTDFITPEDVLVEDKDYNFIYDSNDNVVSAIFFPIHSKGTFDINVNDDYLRIGENSLERKVKSETVKARLVSPNFAASFDFNPQKNNGVNIINVDYNYKPYMPYIHVSPIFSGLYGEDFNDARGLICSGDFSISTVSSKWEEYQIQNKNFENIFNRQIENIDVNNSIAMEKAKYTAVLGTISTGFSTAVGGGIAGSEAGPGGAIAGALIGATVGTTLSAIGGVKDVELLVKQQSENRDYAVDMYTYNLQNIQALPYTLSKVSAYNENNKIFPFIEIYDCTDIEKQNLRDKIKYNGMTVMTQGKIEDYVISEGDYIQAQLIRIEDFDDDSHVLVEIYNELMKGVYIYGW